MAPHRAALVTCAIILASTPAYAQDADDGCFIQYTVPALIETVTKQVLVQEEVTTLNGETVVTSPAIYRTETVQRIVRDRHEAQTGIICEKDLTVVFIQSMQRALSARGYYNGNISGILDDRTGRAIRKVQKTQGINSPKITLDLAESYGLVVHRTFLN